MNNVRIVKMVTFLKSKNWHKLFGMLFHHQRYTNKLKNFIYTVIYRYCYKINKK